MEYDVIIEQDRSDLNNLIISTLTKYLKSPYTRKKSYLDVGCNTGWLLSICPNGFGVDSSRGLVALARRKNLKCAYGDVEKGLAIPDNSYDIVVLSCVLQHLDSPLTGILEAMRIAKHRVIGVAPWPGKTEWGRLGGNKWTKSVLWPDKMKEFFNSRIVDLDGTHYFFEFDVTRSLKKNPLRARLSPRASF